MQLLLEVQSMLCRLGSYITYKNGLWFISGMKRTTIIEAIYRICSQQFLGGSQKTVCSRFIVNNNCEIRNQKMQFKVVVCLCAFPYVSLQNNNIFKVIVPSCCALLFLFFCHMHAAKWNRLHHCSVAFRKAVNDSIH